MFHTAFCKSFASLAFAALLAAPLATANAADNYDLDLAHSAFVFRVKHLDRSYTYGRFNEAQGQISLDRDNPAQSTFNMSIAAESIDTGNAKRDEHLRGPDFFNARQFPNITFKTTSVERSGNTYRVTGDLTLHGQTKPVTFDLELLGDGADPWGNQRVGFNTSFSIQRSDFGMTYGIDNGIVGDQVDLMISFEATGK
jgi:polyisoprenoid-binding protein YceI